MNPNITMTEPQTKGKELAAKLYGMIAANRGKRAEITKDANGRVKIIEEALK